MVVIKQAVERLDDLETSYGQVLVRLGSIHARNRDFCTDNFALFTDALLYIWKQRLQDKLTEEGLQAWRVLFHYINAKLQEGFSGVVATQCPYSDSEAVTGLNNGTENHHHHHPPHEGNDVEQTEIW